MHAAERRHDAGRDLGPRTIVREHAHSARDAPHERRQRRLRRKVATRRAAVAHATPAPHERLRDAQPGNPDPKAQSTRSGAARRMGLSGIDKGQREQREDGGDGRHAEQRVHQRDRRAQEESGCDRHPYLVHDVEEVTATAVHRLEGAGPVQAAVDALAAPPGHERVVHPPGPAGRAQSREPIGVAGLHERLGASVATLLPQIGPGPRSAVVPDERGGMEPDVPASVEHPPAQVDVVAGGHVDGIEPADLLEHLASEGHVATG